MPEQPGQPGQLSGCGVNAMKRYDYCLGWITDTAPYACMDEREDGDYVRHSDVEQMLTEHARMRILLRATHDLLKIQRDSGNVIDLLEETVVYDGAECDGLCLMQDIEACLDD